MSLISNPICLLMSPYLEKENKTSIKQKKPKTYKQINVITKSDSQPSKREETPEQVLKLLRLPGYPHQLSSASANNKNWGKKVSSLRNSNISWSLAEVGAHPPYSWCTNTSHVPSGSFSTPLPVHRKALSGNHPKAFINDGIRTLTSSRDAFATWNICKLKIFS